MADQSVLDHTVTLQVAEPESGAAPYSLPVFLCALPPLLFIGFRCAWGSCLWPTCMCVSDYSDSSEVKFEELKNVKLEEEDEEEEEEQEAAALDLSVNPASLGGRLVLSGSKKKSSSSLGSGSSRDSISSDSETSEPLSCRAQGQSGVLTVHSYAKGDGRVTVGEPCTRKKGGATGSISERELTEVRALGNAPWLASCGGGRLLGAWGCLLQVSKMAGESIRMGLQSAVSNRKPGGTGSLPLCSSLGVPFLLPLCDCSRESRRLNDNRSPGVGHTCRPHLL